MKMKMSQLRQVIRESIKDLFGDDPDFTYGKGYTEKHYGRSKLFARDWNANLEKTRAELLPLLSPGASVLRQDENMTYKTGDVQIYIPNPTPEDLAVMEDYGFQPAHMSDLSKYYKDREGKVFVRTVDDASNYASFMTR